MHETRSLSDQIAIHHIDGRDPLEGKQELPQILCYKEKVDIRLIKPYYYYNP